MRIFSLHPSASTVFSLVASALTIPSHLAFAENAPPFATVVYTMDGKGDGGFTDMAAEGVARAKKELNVEILEIEPQQSSNFEASLEKGVKAGSKIVIGVGFDQAQAITAVAKRYPKNHFAILDGVGDAPNLASIVFRAEEGSYLAGYVAAKYSKKMNIGFVGGMPIPPLKSFFSGYAQGAKKANPKIQIQEAWLGEVNDFSVFNNPVKMKEVARKQIEAGADVTYTAAGGSIEGLFELIRETKTYGIGVDKNQNDAVPNFMLTSMLKRIDEAVIRVIKMEKNGAFKGGIQSYGVAEQGVGLALDEAARKVIGSKLADEALKLEKEIASGEIKVKP